MDLESTVMLYEYLLDPANYQLHHMWFWNSVVMTVGFGRTEKEEKFLVNLIPPGGEFSTKKS